MLCSQVCVCVCVCVRVSEMVDEASRVRRNQNAKSLICR